MLKQVHYQNNAYNSFEVFVKDRIDLTGMIFTRLLVLGISKKKTYSNLETLWECQCSCGKKCIAPGYLLRQKFKKSCGCLWKPNNLEYIAALKHKLEINSKWVGQCHVWTGAINRKGFGKTQLTPKTSILVQHLSWMIDIGKIKRGVKIIQICGNPLCFRAEHLRVNSKKDC